MQHPEEKQVGAAILRRHHQIILTLRRRLPAKKARTKKVSNKQALYVKIFDL
jgi:hypothetical protein